MKVSPSDVRFMVVINKTTRTANGTTRTPHILIRDCLTRDAAEDQRPAQGWSTVVGYVSNHRRQRQEPITA